MSKAAQMITEDYEIIYVNDGSTDHSLEKLLDIYDRDEHVIIIDLTRNFGQPNAMRTGLRYAKGDVVFIIDDDLEEQPEWLPNFYQTLKETNSEVVFSAQHKRKGGGFEKYSGALFFFFLQRMLRAQAIHNVMTARLMTHEHACMLSQFKENKASFTALSLWTGCKYKVLYFDKMSRNSTSYNMRKRLRLMINHITSTSLHPLYWPLTLATSWIAFCILFFASTLLPRVSLLSNIDFFQKGTMLLAIVGIGFILVSLSIISIYFSQMFDEMRGRPIAFIRKIYTRQATCAASANNEG
jgi:putative glycosyltransferase